MKRSTRVAPRVEMLEGRALLTTVPVAPSAGTVQVAARLRPIIYPVRGTINGTYLLAADGNRNVLQFNGTGNVSPLGDVEASAPPTVLPARIPNNVTLTLVGDAGNLVLRFTKGRGPLNLDATQQRGTFRILGGTGAYARATGNGNGVLSITPTSADGTTGQFSLALNGRSRL